MISLFPPCYTQGDNGFIFVGVKLPIKIIDNLFVFFTLCSIQMVYVLILKTTSNTRLFLLVSAENPPTFKLMWSIQSKFYYFSFIIVEQNWVPDPIVLYRVFQLLCEYSKLCQSSKTVSCEEITSLILTRIKKL